MKTLKSLKKTPDWENVAKLRTLTKSKQRKTKEKVCIKF